MCSTCMLCIALSLSLSCVPQVPRDAEIVEALEAAREQEGRLGGAVPYCGVAEGRVSVPLRRWAGSAAALTAPGRRVEVPPSSYAHDLEGLALPGADLGAVAAAAAGPRGPGPRGSAGVATASKSRSAACLHTL